MQLLWIITNVRVAEDSYEDRHRGVTDLVRYLLLNNI
jgi:hypothetical protein